MLPDCTMADDPAGRIAPQGWDDLPDALQLQIAHAAMLRAGERIASLAVMLAGEIEHGVIADRGAPEALRLLARIIRLTGQDLLAPAGTA